jgi:hypothetical protein
VSEAQARTLDAEIQAFEVGALGRVGTSRLTMRALEEAGVTGEGRLRFGI